MSEEAGIFEHQPATLQQQIDQAVAFHSAGALDKAELIYQRILKAEPDQPVVLNMSGVLAHQRGHNDMAVDLIRRAINTNPLYFEAHMNLCVVLKVLKQFDEAVDIYQKALSIHPRSSDVCYELGLLLQNLERPEEAITYYQKAIDIKPDYFEAYNNLGNIYAQLGKVDEEETAYRKALAIKPSVAEMHSNLGNALSKSGRWQESIDSYNQAIRIKPAYAEAHYNLGAALKEQNKLEEAEASYRHALSLQPDYAKAYNNLAHILKDLGKPQDAADNYRKALALKPDYPEAHSNLLLAEQFIVGNSTETLFPMHRKWDEQQGQRYRKNWPIHANTRDPERRIRIGFVSPDLGHHPVGYFTVGLFENLSKQRFETVCYSDRRADDMTHRIKAVCDLWRTTLGDSDENLSQHILNDGIDILVDLSGHTANNRLCVFVRKPAPLQISWAGYVGTTGLAAMDYLISDSYSTRAGEDKFCQENVLRMPNGYVCYSPPDHMPDVGPPPSAQNGHVTFGSFNNPAKLSDPTIALWADILKRVDGARLLLKYSYINSAPTIQRLTKLFQLHGIDASRLTFEGSSPHAQLLEKYNDVDIALDPFPYSGGLTTLEALYMGVPVITLPGQTFASRHSECHLQATGLPHLIATDPDDYVNRTVALANDSDRRADLRLNLRDQMHHSPACDAVKFTTAFAAHMRDIWRDWCASSSAGSTT